MANSLLTNFLSKLMISPSATAFKIFEPRTHKNTCQTLPLIHISCNQFGKKESNRQMHTIKQHPANNAKSVLKQAICSCNRDQSNYFHQHVRLVDARYLLHSSPFTSRLHAMQHRILFLRLCHYHLLSHPLARFVTIRVFQK